MIPFTTPQQVTGPGTVDPTIAHVMPSPAASHQTPPIIASAVGGVAAPRFVAPQQATLPFTRT